MMEDIQVEEGQPTVDIKIPKKLNMDEKEEINHHQNELDSLKQQVRDKEREVVDLLKANVDLK